MPNKPKPKSFSRLGAAAKRVAIAEDILKQIKAERYHIRSGTWLNVDPVEPVEQTNQETSSEMVRNALLGGKHTVVMNAPPATCTCCAVGAACASAIRLFNKDALKGSPQDGYELGSYTEGLQILRKYFPAAQVDLMEAAFEKRTDSHHKTANKAALVKAVDFGDEHHIDTERLKAICKNIITNKGTFKP